MDDICYVMKKILSKDSHRCFYPQDYRGSKNTADKFADSLVTRYTEVNQAGTELGQAQLQLELGFTLIKVWYLTLMITDYIYIS